MGTTVVTTPDHDEKGRCTSRTRRYIGRMVIFVVAAGAIACSTLTILSCDFFRLIATLGDGSAFWGVTNTNISNIGIFSYQLDDTGTCRAYLDTGRTIFQPSNWLDTMWITAQYAALIAPVLGAVASLLTLAEFIIGKFCGSFLLPALLYLLACTTQGVTFFMYNEKDVCYRLDAEEMEIDAIIRNSCQLSLGAFLSIAAGFLYYVCSMLLCCLPRPDRSFCPSIKLSSQQDGSKDNGQRHKAILSSGSRRELDVEQPSQASQGDMESGNLSLASSRHGKQYNRP
ncbi:hypothetical protein IV203_021025 [Nitzschia inconspicua]|uniref:Uncharacterized protein n=1 Tax=Nitzschia inconspicua TaxID=303405 RepID=A0A9K3KH39_9STRA|nr:hypothetical protein IV203_021025 [Nitzschia inconspicua]